MPAPEAAPLKRGRKRKDPAVGGAAPSAMPATPPLAAPIQVVPSGATLEAAAMAELLEAHPDYRVLRRLQPRLLWPAAATGVVTTVVILDTETTGLDARSDSIIELAMLRVDVDSATGLPVGPVQVYDGLEDPGRPIPKEVVALTGISDDDVRGQQLDAQRVMALLEGAPLVIAHNAGFDRPFVEKRFSRFAELPWACSFADIDWKAQGRSSAKLENLALALGWFYDAHRAEMDCHALLAVLAAPLPQLGHSALAHVMRAAQAPSYLLQATGAPFDAKDALKARAYRWNAEQRVWQIRLGDAQALETECAWLKDKAYNGRMASVQIETQDARVKFSQRLGVVVQRAL